MTAPVPKTGQFKAFSKQIKNLPKLPSTSTPIIEKPFKNIQIWAFFSVNFTNMNDPLIFAGFSSDGGSTLARMLILTEANFALWEAGEPFVAALRSGRTPTNSARFLLPTNGTYRVVFSNREDTVNARSLGIFASLLWQPPS